MIIAKVRQLLVIAAAAAAFCAARAQDNPGYYRFPALHGDTVVFTAEGDLWRVSTKGGLAQRLTTHAGLELLAAISPDGKWLAFSGQYEGPTEVYVMPLGGGLPTRLTYEGEAAQVRGWTPAGKVLYATRHFATLPDNQLVAIDPVTRQQTFVPLAQADEGVYDDAGQTLFFTRYGFQGSHAKRYAGGTAQNLWSYRTGAKEAVQLHPGDPGTSHWPMWWQGRLYFAGERDGTSNLWSAKPDGSDLRQHTSHADFGIKRPMQQGGRIVYQNGADLFLYDIATNKTAPIAITLASDFDQLRETWVHKPADHVSGFNLSPDGDRLALTVRGQVFVAPTGQGRLAEITRQSGVRYRSSAFMPDGKSLLVLSDESGEVEFWRAPANGVGPTEQVTKGGKVLRLFGLVSPDGKWLAYAEHNQDLWLFNLETKEARKIAHSNYRDFSSPGINWSPDSKWLAYAITGETANSQIALYNLATAVSTSVTSERVNSGDPAFSPDGKWLYFLSDRSFVTSVGAPWGPRQPEPFLDKPTKIYQLALGLEKRSPFQAHDELADADKKADKPAAKDDKKTEPEKTAGADAQPADATKPGAENGAAPKSQNPPPVVVVLDGIQERLWEVPVPAGNYDQLRVTDKALFVIDREAGPASPEPRFRLVGVEIKNKDIEAATVLAGITAYRVSADGKKLAVQQKEDFIVIDAAAKPAGDITKAKINLTALKFAYSPRESWRQMFTDAWRMHRDYYYDKNMHGVDWPANRAKHLPLVDRITDRSELNDLINYLVSELSSLHTDARGGDLRKTENEITVATLGARWSREEKAGGYRLDRIYVGDPDFPERLGPLLKPGIGIRNGDVILEINGTPTLSVADAEMLLRNQAGRQVLLRVQPAAGGDSFSRIVVPAPAAEAAALRYSDWEYTRMKSAAAQSDNQIGYVHLRAMGAGNYSEWARNYYSNLNRAGLILDLRHNQGGNIESWIMSRLMRPAWMWWSSRDGTPYPNFQNAFRGHLVVLVDSFTASDGETMANGVRQLGLGKVMGVRTWGGGIWLTGQNILADRGVARAAEFGTYIPGIGWVIEGDGFTPDIIVDNNPATAYHGADAQLDAAVIHLQALIKANPKHLIPIPPPYPDKSLKK